MAAPSYWKKMGVTGYNLELEEMLTGVFLHEFSHTRQFRGFGKQVDSFEQADVFKEIKMDDDLVQRLFEKDSAYKQNFLSEVQVFYDAAFARDKAETKRLARIAMAMLRKRQQTYFTKGNVVLKKPEELFLSIRHGSICGRCLADAPQRWKSFFLRSYKWFPWQTCLVVAGRRSCHVPGTG